MVLLKKYQGDMRNHYLQGAINKPQKWMTRNGALRNFQKTSKSHLQNEEVEHYYNSYHRIIAQTSMTPCQKNAGQTFVCNESINFDSPPDGTVRLLISLPDAMDIIAKLLSKTLKELIYEVECTQIISGMKTIKRFRFS